MVEKILDQEAIDAMVRAARGGAAAETKVKQKKVVTWDVRQAAQIAMRLPESEWPVLRRRFGTRPGRETVRRAEELRSRRDRAAAELDLEPSFIAPRSAIEAIAADETCGTTLLVPWQRAALGI